MLQGTLPSLSSHSQYEEGGNLNEQQKKRIEDKNIFSLVCKHIMESLLKVQRTVWFKVFSDGIRKWSTNQPNIQMLPQCGTLTSIKSDDAEKHLTPFSFLWNYCSTWFWLKCCQTPTRRLSHWNHNLRCHTGVLVTNASQTLKDSEMTFERLKCDSRSHLMTMWVFSQTL